MTVKEFNKAFAAGNREAVRDYERVVRNVHQEASDRIFLEGGLGDDGKTRFQYSTKHSQAGEEAFVFKSAFMESGFQGFNKEQRAKSGKKGYYFMDLPGGYKQLKAVQGMQSGHVDLNYEGDLFQAYRNGLTKKNQREFFVKLPAKENEKMDFAIAKYGDFTGLNEDEFVSLTELLQQSYIDSLKKHGIP